MLLLCVCWSQALEKDIEVTCLEAKAATITDGGVIANCAFQGLTRTSTINPWLFQLTNVLQVKLTNILRKWLIFQLVGCALFYFSHKLSQSLTLIVVNTNVSSYNIIL